MTIEPSAPRTPKPTRRRRPAPKLTTEYRITIYFKVGGTHTTPPMSEAECADLCALYRRTVTWVIEKRTVSEWQSMSPPGIGHRNGIVDVALPRDPRSRRHRHSRRRESAG